MKKEIIGKVLVVVAMAFLTFTFAALSVHYDTFAVGFRETPVSWFDALTGLCVIIVAGLVPLGLGCAFIPQVGILLLLPFEVWDEISEKYSKWQHLINVFLLALCIAFVAYAVNLVTILEHISGEHFKQMPTLGGFLAGMYVLVILFGTMIIYGWLSGLIDALIVFFKKCAEAERKYAADRQKQAERQAKRAAQKKKIHYTKL